MTWYTTPLRSMETLAEGGLLSRPDRELAPRLMVILGREPGKTFPIPMGESVLGRDIECDIKLPDASVSRRHARIVRNADGGVNVADGLSTNGTHVNDRKVSESQLANGDILRVGNVLLKYYEPGTIEAEVFQRVFQMAMNDSLTETLTKSAITYHLETIIQNESEKFSVILVDIDHFKQVNDTYGHIAGDFVLHQVATVLKNSILQTGALIGRFGGEEFLIVLPDKSLEEALQIAEQARMAIELEVVQWKEHAISITASFGLTGWCVDDSSSPEPVQSLLERADKALYQAKNEGRNRVCSRNVD